MSIARRSRTAHVTIRPRRSMAHTTKHFCGTMGSNGPRPEDRYHHNTAWHVDEIAFRQMLTWAAGLDRRRIEQKGCTMPTPDYVGFDIDRFCWTLAHDGPDAIVYADFGGLIRFWNRGAERMFGYSAKEAIGSSLDLIMPENLRERHWTAYLETMRTGKTRYGDGD